MGTSVRNPWSVVAGATPDPFAAHIPNHCETAYEGVRCNQSAAHLCDHCLSLCCDAHIFATYDDSSGVVKRTSLHCARCAWNMRVYSCYDEPETDVA